MPRQDDFRDFSVVTDPGNEGITLVTIVGFAFWLGTLSGTVNRSAEKVDKLSDAIIGASRESLSNRLSVIETKLDRLIRDLNKRLAESRTLSAADP